MKEIGILFVCLFFLSGCAAVRLTTEIGYQVGYSFKAAAAKGTVSADESIKAWPYASGVIKGLFSDNYSLVVPKNAQNIISSLDTLAAKPSLTVEDKGYVIGYYTRLEAIAVKQAWSDYGVSIYDLVIKFLKR